MFDKLQEIAAKKFLKNIDLEALKTKMEGMMPTQNTMAGQTFEATANIEGVVVRSVVNGNGYLVAIDFNGYFSYATKYTGQFIDLINDAIEKQQQAQLAAIATAQQAQMGALGNIFG